MKVLLADGDLILRLGLRLAVERGVEEASILEAADLDSALEALAGPDDLDLIVADIDMPGMNGLAGLRRLRAGAPKSRIAILSSQENPQLMIRAVNGGAQAFIPKRSEDDLVIGALKYVLRGGTYLPSRVAGEDDKLLLSGIEPGRAVDSAALGPVTPRQREVLARMAEGLSNQEIGKRLDLSLSTVKSHVTAIFKALDVTNRTQAVLAVSEAPEKATRRDCG